MRQNVNLLGWKLRSEDVELLDQLMGLVNAHIDNSDGIAEDESAEQPKSVEGDSINNQSPAHEAEL